MINKGDGNHDRREIVELVRDFHVYELLPVSSEPKNQATRDANITRHTI